MEHVCSLSTCVRERLLTATVTRSEVHNAHIGITGRIDERFEATSAGIETIREANTVIHVQQSTLIAQAASVLEAKQREEILAWIDDKTAGPRKDCQDVLSDMLPGTCEWLWQCSEYVSWLSDDDKTSTARFFWLYGSPGSGKTVISAATIEDLSTKSTIAYFFCKNQDLIKRQPTSILRSWIDQLVRTDQELLDCASQFYTKGDKPPASIADMWLVLTSIVQRKSHCMLVVDGFDECEDTDDTDRYHQTGAKTKFLTSLTKALQDTCCKVLLVSRHSQNLQSFWANLRARDGPRCVFSREISESDTASDVISYSRDLFDNKLRNKKPEDRRMISSDVALKCEGSFLWVRLVGTQLRAGHNTKKLRSMVQQTPLGLDGAYDRDIRYIKSLQPDDKARAFSILRWVSYAMRPLSVAELTEALIVETVEETEEFPRDELPDEWDDDYVKDRILGLCGSLLIMKSDGPQDSYEKSTIQFVHFSAKEYLLEHAKLAGSELSIGSEQDLGANCLRYLLLKDFDLGRRTPISEIDGLLEEYAFLEYASTYWHVHLRESFPPMESHHLVNQLFEPEETRWYIWAAISEKFYRVPSLDDVAEPQGSALYYCSLLDLEKLASKLLEQDNQVNEAGGYYGTPLQAAVFEGHIEMVKLLLSYGADVNLESGRYGFPIVAVAAKSPNIGCEEILQLLLNSGAKVSSSDHPIRNVALHYAAMTGALGVAQRLIETAKEVNTKDTSSSTTFNPANDMGWTPFHGAAQAGDVEIIKLFVESGVELELKENRGWTALFTAAAYGNVDAVRYLKEEDADPYVVDEHGWTTLHAAAESGSVPTAEYLSSIGLGINRLNGQESTALHGAALAGHLQMAEYLITKGATVDVANENGWTAMHAAAWNGHDTVMNLLLDKGANVEQEDKKAWRPLHLAAQRGHVNSVTLLFNRNAELSPVSQNGWTPLHNACAHGEFPVTEVLLSLNSDPNVTDSEGDTPLILALLKQDERSVTHLISKGAIVNAVGKLGLSAIQYAAFSGLLSLVKTIVQNGGDLNATGPTGFTPMHTAAIQGDLQILEFLLGKNAKVDIPAGEGLLPIHLAAVSGHIHVIESLVAHGRNMKAASVERPTTPHEAASSGHLQAAVCFPENQHGINARTTNGSTSLYLSAISGKEEVVAYLLREKADLRIPTYTGWTPLLASCQEGHLPTVKLLVEHGARPDDTTEDGRTAVIIAMFSGHIEIVDYLLSRNASPDCKSHNGLPAIYIAAEAGSTVLTSLLVSRGADVDRKTPAGLTALYIASLNEDVDIVDILLAKGAKAQPSNGVQYLPLYAAARKGNVKIVDLLIEHGADIKAANYNNFTPLFVAALEGHLEVVQNLLEKGADINTKSTDELTPLYAAASEGYTDTVAYLLSKGAKDHVTQFGDSAIMASVEKGHLKTVQSLLASGADPCTTRRDGWSMVLLAIHKGHFDVAKELYTYGANIMTRTSDGSTVLHQAAMSGKVEIVEWLLTLGLDHNAVDADGETLLHAIATVQTAKTETTPVIDPDGIESAPPLFESNVRTEDVSAMIKCLIDGGVNPDQTTRNGRTALHFAASSGNLGALEELLKHGADPNISDEFQRTPLHLAIYGGFSKCIAVLMKFNAATKMLDGYGYSSLDWAALYEPQLQKMGTSTDECSPTSLDIRVEWLQKSVRFLAQNLLDTEQVLGLGYHDLGHCLMFQGHLEDARVAFEQQVLEVSSDGPIIHNVTCNGHRNEFGLKGTRFVCKTCPDIDLCSICIAQYKQGSVIAYCHGHEFLEIGGQQGDDQRLARQSGEAAKDWLRKLLDRVA